MICERSIRRAVDTALPDESVHRAAERMHQRTVGALVVVDESHKPIGIVTDRDLVLRVICARLDPETATVADVMTRNPTTMLHSGSIADALGLMQSGPFRRLPIVDPSGRLCGIFTLDDIVPFLAKQLLGVGFLLARESPELAAVPKTKAPSTPRPKKVS